MNNISTIQNRCVGCRSCEHTCPMSCISMKYSKEGFLYPEVQIEKCNHCGKCLRSCPVENPLSHRNHPKETWALRNKNDEEVKHSASGGAADLAAQIILDRNGVVYGAAYDSEFNVIHIEVTHDLDRRKIQSSKYVQSDTKDCYIRAKEHLKRSRDVLFTGTPCQIAGLYAYLGKDYSNLYTIDLICHGVPSPKLFKKHIEYLSEKMGGEIIYYNPRSKEKRGWGTQYFLKVETKKQTKRKIFSLDRYGKSFIDGDCFRESCYQCIYSNIDRVGDITVGDFWGILKRHPTFFSSKGISSVFINTKKGLLLFDQIKKIAKIQATTLEEGLEKQANLANPTKRPESRDMFYENIDDKSFMHNISVGLQLKERLKSILPKSIIHYLKSQ